MKIPAWLRWRSDAELDDEIQTHIEMEIRANVERGLSLEQARSAAQRRFGNATRAKERVREADPLFRLESLLTDLRHALRSLRRSPGFAAAAVLTLAVSIGANTAIFSVVDAVVLTPFAFSEPDRLVAIRASAPGSDLRGEVGAGAEFYVQYRENAKTLADLATIQTAQTTVRSGKQSERLFIAVASPSLFSTLRVKPMIGRLPTDADKDGEVAVISHWLWTTWFGSDPSILGKPVEVSNGLRTVIGVMGPDFSFPSERISVWLHDVVTGPITPGNFNLAMVGRMAPGATRESVASELAPLARRIPERFGGTPAYRQIIDHHVPVVRALDEVLIGTIATPLWILMGTVGLVLLIACANVANLMLVRAESRKRDVAVRRALGASRGALIRWQMAEAIVLAALGAVGGVLIAWIGMPLLVRSAPENIPRLSSAGLNATALVFTAGVAVLAACISGLLPAIRFSGSKILNDLRLSTRVASGSGHLTRQALVVVQTAAALVLLVGSGLLAQSFRALNRVDPGFETKDIFTFQTAPDFRSRGMTDAPAFAQFHYALLDRLAALPGIESVGLVDTLPLDEGAATGRVVTRRSEANGDVDPLVRITFTGGDYFQTMGITLLKGSYFARNANPGSDIGVIVSAAAAKFLWPGEEPIGQVLRRAGSNTPWMTVQGVVEDVMLENFKETPDPLIYLPLVGLACVDAPACYQTSRSWIVGTPAYVVRTARAETIAPEIREVIRAQFPEAPMYRVSTMATLAARSMAALSFTMLTLAIAAGVALMLGAVGLYGVLSYVVSQRRREIGIRMALGAQGAAVRRLIVVQGVSVAMIGVALGLIAAFALTRVLDSLLFGVEAIHVATFVAMSGVMAAVAVLASYGPARRASGADPITALRAE
jgi:predicted permease